MVNLETLKDQVRRDARLRRRATAAIAPDAAQLAAAVFIDVVELNAGDIVAVYRAIQSELDPAPLVDALRANGIDVCFPVVTAPETPLEFRVADSSTRFVPGAFGAAIPEDGAAVVRPSVIIAPLLAFDRALFRLGYGGGFYDRTLQMLRLQGSVRAYGYAYAAQEVSKVPIEDTDERLDGVATEQGFIGALPFEDG